MRESSYCRAHNFHISIVFWKLILSGCFCRVQTTKLPSFLTYLLNYRRYITLHYIAVFIVAYSRKNLKEPLWRNNNVWIRVPKQVSLQFTSKHWQRWSTAYCTVLLLYWSTVKYCQSLIRIAPGTISSRRTVTSHFCRVVSNSGDAASIAQPTGGRRELRWRRRPPRHWRRCGWHWTTMKDRATGCDGRRKRPRKHARRHQPVFSYCWNGPARWAENEKIIFSIFALVRSLMTHLFAEPGPRYPVTVAFRAPYLLTYCLDGSKRREAIRSSVRHRQNLGFSDCWSLTLLC